MRPSPTETPIGWACANARWRMAGGMIPRQPNAGAERQIPVFFKFL